MSFRLVRVVMFRMKEYRHGHKGAHNRLKHLQKPGANLPFSLVPGAGLEPAQTFRSEGF